jgi:hypothetical protein
MMREAGSVAATARAWASAGRAGRLAGVDLMERDHTQVVSIGAGISRWWRRLIIKRSAGPFRKILTGGTSRTLRSFPIERPIRTLGCLRRIAPVEAIAGRRRRLIGAGAKSLHQVFGKLRELVAIELAILVVVVSHGAFDKALW